MNIIKPAKLTKGNTVGIVTVSAPEPATEPEWFKRGVDSLIKQGYEVKTSPVAESQHGYLASDEKSMAKDVNNFFADDEIAAIICSGGGVNANRLLPHLDYELIKNNPKVFLGVSNPSVLLNAIYAMTGLVTFHGPSVVWDFGSPDGLPEYTSKHLWPLLEGSGSGPIEPRSKWYWWRPGTARGRLVGGNLISIQGLIGTKWIPNWFNHILFWEDIGKTTNRLDMMLTHFRDIGVFEQISGMVIGELVNCPPPDGGQELDDMLQDIIGEYSFPVLCRVDIGHTADKATLPLGIEAELHSDKNTFTIVESPVV